jgi:hypothetical protein
MDATDGITEKRYRPSQEGSWSRWIPQVHQLCPMHSQGGFLDTGSGKGGMGGRGTTRKTVEQMDRGGEMQKRSSSK